jgi:hypothetical protein
VTKCQVSTGAAAAPHRAFCSPNDPRSAAQSARGVHRACLSPHFHTGRSLRSAVREQQRPAQRVCDVYSGARVYPSLPARCYSARRRCDCGGAAFAVECGASFSCALPRFACTSCFTAVLVLVELSIMSALSSSGMQPCPTPV